MGFVRDISGRTAANAAKASGAIQSDAATLAAGRAVEAGGRAEELFNPLATVGQQGVSQAGFLTDPKAQFDFLQNNPLFQLGLDNANTQTNQIAASRGRLSAGDTLQQLNQNALLTAAPLIQQQKQSIGDLLGISQNVAANQGNIIQGTAAAEGNLLTGAAAATGAGLVGAANARGAGSMNLLNLGLQAGGAAFGGGGGGASGGTPGAFSHSIGDFSDPSLKENVARTGTENGHNTYTWDWNEDANELGMSGSSFGVMADEVLKINPDAVTISEGYMRVNYDMIGVNHGA